MAERVRIKRKDDGGGSYFASPKTKMRFIRTGSKLLDCALGGGWARGRIANIVGDKSTGKTLLCIEACANFIAEHPKAMVRYRESEAAFDDPYAEALGMPLDRVDFGEPLDTVEDLFEDLSDVLKRMKGPELYICDSLDALSDRAEMGRSMDEGSYGAEKAKKLSQMFRRLVRDMEDKDLTLIIVSQIRDKIGAMFGRKFTRTGGRALDFYASQVALLAHLGTEHKTVSGVKRAVGVNIRAKIDKNKIGLAFREAEFPILFGYGVDDILSCLLWLKDVKALKDVGVAENRIKQHARELIEADPDEVREEVAAIHAAVEKKWYEIEQSLLPSRRKYG